MRLRSFIAVVAVFAMLLTNATAASAQQPSKGAAAEGEKVYMSKCSSCHAKDGSGDTAMGKKMKVSDLRAAEIQNRSDAQLTEGIGKVPKHTTFKKSITEKGMAGVVAYLRTLKVATERQKK